MTVPQHLARATKRVVVPLSLALAALVLADSPAYGNRGGDDQEITDAESPTSSTTVTTQALAEVTVTTEAAAPQADPEPEPAGDGQPAVPVEAASDPAPEAPAALAETGTPATPEPAATLPRTGAGAIGEELVLGLGLVGAGLAATAAGRRSRRRSGAQA